MVRKFVPSIVAIVAIVGCAFSGFGAASSYKQGNVVVLKGNAATYSFDTGGQRKLKKVRILGYGGAVNYTLHKTTSPTGYPVVDAYLSGASAGTTTTLQLDLAAAPDEGVLFNGDGVYLSTNSGDTGSSSAVFLFFDRE